MVSPISNDKILPQNSDRNSTATGRRASGEQNSATGAATRPTDDTVELSSAGRLANQEIPAGRGSGAVSSAEEARELVKRIRTQIESAGLQAMKSHGQMEKGQLTSLLEASAA